LQRDPIQGHQCSRSRSRPPTDGQDLTDTPAGTVNACSAPVELKVTDVVAATAEPQAQPPTTPNRPAVTSDTQPPTPRTHANADRTVRDPLNRIAPMSETVGFGRLTGQKRARKWLRCRIDRAATAGSLSRFWLPGRRVQVALDVRR
jgi:hypothetical protein